MVISGLSVFSCSVDGIHKLICNRAFLKRKSQLENERISLTIEHFFLKMQKAWHTCFGRLLDNSLIEWENHSTALNACSKLHVQAFYQIFNALRQCPWGDLLSTVYTAQCICILLQEIGTKLQYQLQLFQQNVQSFDRLWGILFSCIII